MTNCPKCNTEVEPNFDVCWNCNYSFSENDILKFEDTEIEKTNKEINCIRCNVQLEYGGNFKFHEGTRIGILGDLFELFTNRESFDLYICPKCRKVEFFLPK